MLTTGMVETNAEPATGSMVGTNAEPATWSKVKVVVGVVSIGVTRTIITSILYIIVIFYYIGLKGSMVSLINISAAVSAKTSATAMMANLGSILVVELSTLRR